MRGVIPAEGVNPFEIPDGFIHVWDWFIVMRGSAGAGIAGPQPITDHGMLAFFALEGIALEGWETRAIRSLDIAYLQSQFSKDE